MSPLDLDRLPRPNNRYKKVTRHFCTALGRFKPIKNSPQKLIFFVFFPVKIGKKRPPKGMNIYISIWLWKIHFQRNIRSFFWGWYPKPNGLGLPRCGGNNFLLESCIPYSKRSGGGFRILQLRWWWTKQNRQVSELSGPSVTAEWLKKGVVFFQFCGSVASWFLDAKQKELFSNVEICCDQSDQTGGWKPPHFLE